MTRRRSVLIVGGEPGSRQTEWFRQRSDPSHVFFFFVRMAKQASSLGAAGSGETNEIFICDLCSYPIILICYLSDLSGLWMLRV